MADDERNLDAAERALGTEPRSAETPDAHGEREAWEQRLAPLLDAVPQEPVPEGLFQRIRESIATRGEVVQLRRSQRQVRIWRSATAAMAALAAVLALVVIAPQAFFPTPSEKYVALVTSDTDGTVGLVIQFDTQTREATIIPVALSPPEGRSLEMWHLPEGATVPYSIGLLPAGPIAAPTVSAAPGDLFAVSIEPQGGSPNGQPTQPIYHGKVEVVH